MEILSNEEIYVLLKILNSKNFQTGSLHTIEIDKIFAYSELEHLQHEICLSEECTINEILTIENTYRNICGIRFHTGYKLNIINNQLLINYVHKYIQALAQNNLLGLTDRNNLSVLTNEFYIKTKGISNLNKYVTTEIKYMPVILSAYINNLIELKTISNSKYDLTKDLYEDTCLEKCAPPIFNDTVKITIEMNVEDFFQRMTNCINSGKLEVPIDINSIFHNIAIINKASSKKQKEDTKDPKKERYHMQPKQWKLLLCLMKKLLTITSKEQQIAEISKEHLVKNGVIGESCGAQDTAKTRFNKAYNMIKGNTQNESEELLYTKLSDIKYYEFNISKLRNFYQCYIQKNVHLQEEFQKYKNFIDQIVDYD